MKRFLLAVLLVLFATAGFSEDVSKAAGQLPSDPLTFFVHGDTHAGLAGTTTLHRKISKRIIEFNPKMIFHTGDVIHNLSSPEDNWDTFDLWFGWNVQNYEYYPTIGNHDDTDLQLYFDYFTNLPTNGNNGYYYYVEKPEAIFIVLDVHDFGIPSDFNTQKQWLENVLATYSSKLYKFVFFHRASHTYGMRGACTWAATQLDPVFRQYNVDIVFMGHTHAYERFDYGGVNYIVTGGAGGVLHTLVEPDDPPILPGVPPPPDPLIYAEETHNYVTVVVTDLFAYIAARYPDGTVFDSFHIYK